MVGLSLLQGGAAVLREPLGWRQEVRGRGGWDVLMWGRGEEREGPQVGFRGPTTPCSLPAWGAHDFIGCVSALPAPSIKAE